MDVKAVSQGERLVLVGGLLLIVDLLFLPWHDVHLTGPATRVAEALGFDPTPTAVQSPNGGYGIAAVALALVMVTQIAIARFTTLRLPEPRIPWGQIHLIAGVFVLVVLVVKLLRDTSGLGYGAYSAILAALLVAFGGYSIAREAGAPA